MSAPRRLLGDVATGLLVACALAVTGLLARRELLRPAQAAVPAPPPWRVGDWRRYSAPGSRLGPADAADTVVLFSDFQCPACRSAAALLAGVRNRHDGRVAVLYRHFPLAQHPFAPAAARAAECAGEQGRFAAMHDALFDAQPELGRVPWGAVAVRAGVADTARLTACMLAPRTGARLAADAAAARRLGVRATPTLIVNGRVFEGVPSPDSLDHYLLPARAQRAPAAREPSPRGPR